MHPPGSTARDGPEEKVLSTSAGWTDSEPVRKEDTGADKTYLIKRAIRYRRRIQGATKKRALAHFSDDLKFFTKGCGIPNEEFPRSIELWRQLKSAMLTSHSEGGRPPEGKASGGLCRVSGVGNRRGN